MSGKHVRPAALSAMGQRFAPYRSFTAALPRSHEPLARTAHAASATMRRCSGATHGEMAASLLTDGFAPGFDYDLNGESERRG